MVRIAAMPPSAEHIEDVRRAGGIRSVRRIGGNTPVRRAGPRGRARYGVPGTRLRRGGRPAETAADTTGRWKHAGTACRKRRLCRYGGPVETAAATARLLR